VVLSKTDLQAEIQRARNAVCFHVAAGSTSVLTVGRSDWTAEALADNVAAVLGALGATVPGGWANVQALSVRTASSIALPLYSALPAADDAHEVTVPVRPATRLDDLELGSDYDEYEAARRTARDRRVERKKTKTGSTATTTTEPAKAAADKGKGPVVGAAAAATTAAAAGTKVAKTKAMTPAAAAAPPKAAAPKAIPKAAARKAGKA
jgi:ribosome biogenesis protein UTP30